MPYADGTENDPDRPKFCPYCKAELEPRWVGQTKGFVGSKRGASEVAFPLFVCLKCKVSVRISRLPDEPLRTTRKAAHADAHKLIEAALRRLTVSPTK